MEAHGIQQLIRLHRVHMPPRDVLMPALERVLYSGHVTQGPQGAEFETTVGRFLGSRFVTAVNSGTTALQLALRLARVRGGQVITTPMTCTATNMPILAESAHITWADVNPLTGNIDPADVDRKVTQGTRAILAVHWGGQPADMDALNAIGHAYGIPVIEDAAHALGATWDGRKIGNKTADYTCFSLQAIKHVTTIDGGLLTTRYGDAYERARRLRWYGINRDDPDRIGQDIPEWGHKWHMNDVAATIGLAQMRYLPSILADCRRNAAVYDSALCGRLGTVRKPSKGVGAWWLYTVLLDSPGHRDRFTVHMRDAGIEVSRVHSRNDTKSCFTAYRAKLPGVDEFTSRMCCVPVHSGLTTAERDRVAEALAEFT